MATVANASRQLQPLTSFRGAAHLGSYGGHAPNGEGAICDPKAFTGIVEAPAGHLGPRHGSITVDLVEPGQALHEHPWAEIYRRIEFKEAMPWVVITVGRTKGEER